MQIRILGENEIHLAVHTAHEVFEQCVRAHMKSPMEEEQFYRYVCVENLLTEMRSGRLILWGAFAEGIPVTNAMGEMQVQESMAAVGAMQSVGHITMLYVRPQYSRRKIGTQLLNHMSSFAAERLYSERVTINVMPIAAASYFYHMGFTLIQNVPRGDYYVPLERRIWSVPQQGAGYERVNRRGEGSSVAYGMPTKKPVKPEVTYPVKKVSAKRIAVLVAGMLFFCFAVIGGVTIHHIVTEGLRTEMNYQLEEGKSEELKETLPEGMGNPEEL